MLRYIAVFLDLGSPEPTDPALVCQCFLHWLGSSENNVQNNMGPYQTVPVLCGNYSHRLIIALRHLIYVAAKATYIRLLHGKIGILEGFSGPSSVHRGRTQIVLG